MPSYQFNDSEPKTFELWPIADYLGEVTACEFSIINGGGKTNGSDAMELTIRFERRNPTTGATEQKEVQEKLIFHESTGWKVDLFAKSFNLLIDGKPPTKGQSIEWAEHMVVGLRGWSTLGIEEYVSKRDGQKKKINKVVVFIVNKDKLPKIVAVGEEFSDADDYR